MWMWIVAALILITSIGTVTAGSYCYTYYSGGYTGYYCYYYYSVNVGAIVGGVIGGLIGLGVLITIIVVLCVCVCNKKRHQPGTIVQPGVVTYAHTSGGYINQGMTYPQPLGVQHQQQQTTIQPPKSM